MSDEAESRRLGPAKNPPPISLQVSQGTQRTVSSLLFLKALGTVIQSALVSLSLSLSLSLPILIQLPAQHHHWRHCSPSAAVPCVHAHEWRRPAEQPNLPWFLLKAVSLSPQLRGLNKGYFPLSLSLLRWRLSWILGRKNCLLIDASQIRDAAIWGHP